MARPLKPFIRGGGFYPSRRWTPLVYPGGYTTANGGGQPEPEAVLKTVTGSLIHITDALALPAEALTVNVEPIQDLHGYDAPWPAGGGKNKLDWETVWSDFLSNGVLVNPLGTTTFSIPSALVGQQLTFSAKVKANSSSANCRVVCNVGGTNTNGTLINSTSSFETSSVTFTPQSTSDYILLTSSGPNGTYKDLQLELGSTATTYAPYSNICPISGRTSATVTRTGRNLLNPADYLFNERTQAGLTYTVQNDGSIHVTGTATSSGGPGLTWNIEIPNGTYTWRNLEYSENVYFLLRKRDKASGTTSSLGPTFTADGTFYIYVNLYCKAVGTYDMTIYPQLELASTPSAYEPYQGNTYTIQLGDTVYGGTLDVTQGKMVVDRAMYTFSESDVWIKYETGGKMTFNSGDRFPVGVDTRKPCIMSNYPFIKTAYISIQPDKSFSLFSSPWLSVCDSGYSDASTFASAMAGNQLVYYLATPIEITLTPTQIEMLLGENNLWSDAGDSTLTYYAEGEASTSEALGILLGGTYNNPGGADDASDDEALGILLGGS